MLEFCKVFVPEGERERETSVAGLFAKEWLLKTLEFNLYKEGSKDGSCPLVDTGWGHWVGGRTRKVGWGY